MQGVRTASGLKRGTLSETGVGPREAWRGRGAGIRLVPDALPPAFRALEGGSSSGRRAFKLRSSNPRRPTAHVERADGRITGKPRAAVEEPLPQIGDDRTPLERYRRTNAAIARELGSGRFGPAAPVAGALPLMHHGDHLDRVAHESVDDGEGKPR